MTSGALADAGGGAERAAVAQIGRVERAGAVQLNWTTASLFDDNKAAGAAAHAHLAH